MSIDPLKLSNPLREIFNFDRHIAWFVTAYFGQQPQQHVSTLRIYRKGTNNLLTIVDFFNLISGQQDYQTITIHPKTVPLNETHWHHINPWTYWGQLFNNSSSPHSTDSHPLDANVKSNSSYPASLPDLIPLTPSEQDITKELSNPRPIEWIN